MLRRETDGRKQTCGIGPGAAPGGNGEEPLVKEMPLCAERHYMGSAAAGRYTTDRGVGPSYERPPAPEMLAHGRACSHARLARYVREQDVLWWVADCQDAKDELAWGEERAELLEAARAQAETPADVARLDEALAELRARMDEALNRKREASRQLRLIGVSPKAQARLAAELRERARTAKTVAGEPV